MTTEYNLFGISTVVVVFVISLSTAIVSMRFHLIGHFFNYLKSNKRVLGAMAVSIIALWCVFKVVCSIGVFNVHAKTSRATFNTDQSSYGSSENYRRYRSIGVVLNNAPNGLSKGTLLDDFVKRLVDAELFDKVCGINGDAGIKCVGNDVEALLIIQFFGVRITSSFVPGKYFFKCEARVQFIDLLPDLLARNYYKTILFPRCFRERESHVVVKGDVSGLVNRTNVEEIVADEIARTIIGDLKKEIVAARENDLFGANGLDEVRSEVAEAFSVKKRKPILKTPEPVEWIFSLEQPGYMAKKLKIAEFTVKNKTMDETRRFLADLLRINDYGLDGEGESAMEAAESFILDDNNKYVLKQTQFVNVNNELKSLSFDFKPFRGETSGRMGMEIVSIEIDGENMLEDASRPRRDNWMVTVKLTDHYTYDELFGRLVQLSDMPFVKNDLGLVGSLVRNWSGGHRDQAEALKKQLLEQLFQKRPYDFRIPKLIASFTKDRDERIAYLKEAYTLTDGKNQFLSERLELRKEIRNQEASRDDT